MNSTTESENASTPDVPQKMKRGTAKKAKPAKKTARAKKAGKPAAERNNKTADVIALLKRAKGATLVEIMAATKWQAHTVRRYVSILGNKGGEKIESSKNVRQRSAAGFGSARLQQNHRPGHGLPPQGDTATRCHLPVQQRLWVDRSLPGSPLPESPDAGSRHK
jgi:hypothetical protein